MTKRGSARGQTELAAGAQRDRAGGVDVVVGGAEEHELAGGEPRQDRVDVAEREHPFAHRSEVLDDAPHVLDGGGDRLLQLLGRRLVGAVDLDLRPGFDGAVGAGDVGGDVGEAVVVVTLHRQHRVDEEVDTEAEALEHETHRVDEERHVVGDDQEHGVLRVPAVALTIGRQHPHDGLSRRTDPGEREVGHGDGVDVVELAVVDVALGELGVVGRQEPHEQRVVGPAQRGHVAQSPQGLGHHMTGCRGSPDRSGVAGP